MFGSLGVPELLLIFVVILIVFGPRRIPEIGRTLGKALGEFRKATDDLKSTIEKEVRLEELKKITPPTLESFMADSVSRNEPFTPGVPPPPVTVLRDDATSNSEEQDDNRLSSSEPVVEPMTPARSE